MLVAPALDKERGGKAERPDLEEKCSVRGGGGGEAGGGGHVGWGGGGGVVEEGEKRGEERVKQTEREIGRERQR